MIRRPAFATSVLLLAGTLAATSIPAGAVVQARSAREAGPRVTGRVQGGAPRDLGRVGLLPLGDAPRAPGTGQAVGEFLCSALSARGARCVPLTPPVDAGGKPISGALVGDTRLAATGRDAGVAVAVTGKVTLLDVEADWLPNLTVWRKGVFVDIPAGGVVRTSLAFRIHAVDAVTGRSLCSTQVRYGPVERPPRPILEEAAAAALDRCFGPPPI